MVSEMKAYKISTRQAHTRVFKPGEVLVIGGLMDNRDQHQIQKIPILGDIPLLGKLFRHSRKTKDSIEMLILSASKCGIIKVNDQEVVNGTHSNDRPWKVIWVRQVFSNVSFEIKKVIAQLWQVPNGAGKSTLLKCILGYEDLDEGNVVKSPVASIGYLQQDVNLGDDSLATEIEKAWVDVHALEEQLKNLPHAQKQKRLVNLIYNDQIIYKNRLEWLGGYDYEQKD